MGKQGHFKNGETASDSAIGVLRGGVGLSNTSRAAAEAGSGWKPAKNRGDNMNTRQAVGTSFWEVIAEILQSMSCMKIMGKR